MLSFRIGFSFANKKVERFWYFKITIYIYIYKGDEYLIKWGLVTTGSMNSLNCVLACWCYVKYTFRWFFFFLKILRVDFFRFVAMKFIIFWGQKEIYTLVSSRDVGSDRDRKWGVVTRCGFKRHAGRGRDRKLKLPSAI